MARWRYNRRKQRWSRWATPVLAIGLVAAWYLTKPLVAPQEWVKIGARFGTCGEKGRPFHCVSDGDTVTIGFGANARRIRLTGFDAPEIAGRCDAESTQALLAQRALLDWLNKGQFEWDGGTSPPRDRYGRELRAARRVSRDREIQHLAEYMIDVELAEGGAIWERRDWCD
ncbi:thermonuclease family protein [Altererythrobacter sp. GH1-8]|uniref:thermonuclease family protein n=1 Tax=Altererythrobacter sp. GH1-8 TaxID=3349333 RepID=UPI00374CE26C